MKESIVFDKSKNFALRIIALYKYLCAEKKEFVLSKQVLRNKTKIKRISTVPIYSYEISISVFLTIISSSL